MKYISLSSSSSGNCYLFEDGDTQIKNQDMQKAIDALHKKYGKNSILRASALIDGSTAIERHNQIGGHRK